MARKADIRDEKPCLQQCGERVVAQIVNGVAVMNVVNMRLVARRRRLTLRKEFGGA